MMSLSTIQKQTVDRQL